MTTVSEEAREGSFPAPDLGAESTAGTRAGARDDTPPPSPAALQAATRRVRALHGVLARAAEILDRPESLVHAHPPTFARARELHHEAAGRHYVPVLRAARLTWGYAHLLLVKPVLNGLEWVTETPLRLFGATVLALIVWYWS